MDKYNANDLQTHFSQRTIKSINQNQVKIEYTFKEIVNFLA